MSGTYKKFLSAYEQRVIPLDREANEAYWAATTTGRPEEEERAARATAALRKAHSDPAEYTRLKNWQAGGAARGALEERQLDLLVRRFTEQQLPRQTIEELARREQEIQSRFTSFRPELDGRPATENDLRRVLAEEPDPSRRRAAWEAAKRIGAEVAPLLKSLVAERNRVARGLGFRDYFALRLAVDELEEKELFALLDDLDRRTAPPFGRAKAELDSELTKRFGVRPEDLRPWHYADPFFQEAPRTGSLDADSLFTGKDVVELARRTYAGMGVPVDDVLARSDLYERAGKYQHAYSMDVDRAGDVRVLANVRADEHWAGTMLHELGHAAYSKYHDRGLPWLLRDAAHIFTTEAVAMLMGRLASDADWLVHHAGVPAAEAREHAEALARHRRLGELVFVRWGLVMVNFERELYRDPTQDLNGLWWRLVARLQQVTPPEGREEPDYASKTHLGTAPVYYQNYLLGTLAASQIRSALPPGPAALTSPSALTSLAAGEFLRERIFRVGAQWHWNEMLRRATGRPLGAEAFLAEYAG